MKTITNKAKLENNHVEFLLKNNSLNYKGNTDLKKIKCFIYFENSSMLNNVIFLHKILV